MFSIKITQRLLPLTIVFLFVQQHSLIHSCFGQPYCAGQSINLRILGTVSDPEDIELMGEFRQDFTEVWLRFYPESSDESRPIDRPVNSYAILGTKTGYRLQFDYVFDGGNDQAGNNLLSRSTFAPDEPNRRLKEELRQQIPSDGHTEIFVQGESSWGLHNFRVDFDESNIVLRLTKPTIPGAHGATWYELELGEVSLYPMGE